MVMVETHFNVQLKSKQAKKQLPITVVNNSCENLFEFKATQFSCCWRWLSFAEI